MSKKILVSCVLAFLLSPSLMFAGNGNCEMAVNYLVAHQNNTIELLYGSKGQMWVKLLSVSGCWAQVKVIQTTEKSSVNGKSVIINLDQIVWLF